MSDKKNEDFAVRMPEGSDAFEEKDPFMAKTSLSRRGSQPAVAVSLSKLDNSPGLSVLAYCLSSISMTLVNKYVVSGTDWNMNFLYLGIQVCHRHRRRRRHSSRLPADALAM